HAFVGKWEMLDEREIRIDKVRTIERGAVCVPQFPGRRVREGARIEPVLKRVDLSWTVRSTALGPSSIRVTHLIGTIKAISIPSEVDSRRVDPVGREAVNHEEREPGSDSLDDIHF